MKDVVYGLVAGALGALIWAGVVYFTEYEIGWIAWGVGAMVGFAVALGNEDGRRSPTAAGVLAVAITVVSIVAGKYLAVQTLMPSDEEIVELFTADFEREEFVVSYLADDIAVEFEEAGRTVSWPEGSDPSNAASQGDYPPDVWAEAERRWAEWAPEERDDFRTERRAEVAANVEASLPELRAMFASGGFTGSFSPMDLIFFGLAMVTAWGMGSGRKSGEQVQAEFTEAVKLSMLRVMLADGEVEDDEAQAAAEIFQQMTGQPTTAEAMKADAAVAASGGQDLDATLRNVGPHLNDAGRAMVVKAALVVALADGAFAQEEQQLVHGIARSIGLDDEGFRAVVAEVTAAEEAAQQAPGGASTA